MIGDNSLVLFVLVESKKEIYALKELIEMKMRLIKRNSSKSFIKCKKVNERGKL